MKSIRNISIAILLGLFLAIGSWQVARAPQYDADIVPDRGQGIAPVSRTTPRPTARSQNGGLAIATLEVTEQQLPATVSTATPEDESDSCSERVIGSGVFVWPTDNHALSGNDYGTGHPGIDLAAGEGSPVYATDAGVVVAEGNDAAFYGSVIQIDHGNGYLTVYAHLSEIDVRICERVEAGQRIGSAGSTGNANGAHLHFEVALDGFYINPWDMLP